MCLSLIVTPAPVDLLDLLDQVALHGILAARVEVLLRVDRPVGDRIAGADLLAVLDAGAWRCGDHVLRSTRSSAWTASWSPSRARIPFSGATTSVEAPSLPATRATTWLFSTRSPAAARTSCARREAQGGLVLLDARHLDLGQGVAADDLHDPVDVADLGLALGHPGLEELLDAREAGGDVGPARGGDAAGVEGPHRQLGARLADGLRGDDPDRLAGPHEEPRREVAAVAAAADAVAGLAGERRADEHLADAGLLEAPPDLLADLLVALAQEGPVGIDDRRGGEAPDEPARERPGLQGDLVRLGARDPAPLLRPQSSSRVITSWATSTRRRVR